MIDFSLDKDSKYSFYEQIKMQVCTYMILGGLDEEQKLPSIREFSKKLSINHKTAFNIYKKLEKEGLLEIKKGSGVYVKKEYKNEHRDFYVNSVFNFFNRVMKDAGKIGLSSGKFLKLLNALNSSDSLKHITCGFVDTNFEELMIYSREIRKRVGVKVKPFYLSELENPTAEIIENLESVDYLITTQFHYTELL
ncbi:hypothetical protein DRQ09_08590, partial [candidate division KSB1 bacterium]